MKKTLSLFLVLVMVLSLCACGQTSTQSPAPTSEAPQEPSYEEQMYKKYESIISSLEAEDYDGVIEAVTAMKSISNPPPSTVVQITMDNYLDYFDLTKTVTHVEKDAYGNPFWMDRELALQLKEEYSCVPDNPGEITVGYEAERNYTVYQGTDADFEAFTTNGRIIVSENSLDSRTQKSSRQIDVSTSRVYLYCPLSYEQLVNDNGNIIADIAISTEIVNISGTICLLND